MSIKIENVVLPSPEQWESIIVGMRHPLLSYEKSDTVFIDNGEYHLISGDSGPSPESDGIIMGSNDLDLMMRLRNAGTEHRKMMRMITVYMDITAPLYWWKEFDTYKVATVANSCSTMHKIHAKEFTLEDFSCEHLFNEDDMLKHDKRSDIEKDNALAAVNVDGDWCYFTPQGFMQMTCNILNHYRKSYLETKDKEYWWQMIQLLPSSYNQKRKIMLNYEVLAAMYHQRKNHKLDEWREFCSWIETLPYSELITGSKPEEK